MNAQHTPTPWTATQARDGHYMIHEDAAHKTVHEVSLAHAKTEANAAFIVRACNSHDALVAALKAVRADLRSFCGVVGRSHGVHSERACATDRRYRDVCAALAAAGES